jgi:hypothetical protein
MNTQSALRPELESLLAFWFVQCGERKFPMRCHLGGSARWQRNLASFGVVQYGCLRVYECHSCAQGLTVRLGRSAIGLSTDELPAEIRTDLRAGFEQAWERRAPHIARARVPKGGRIVRYTDLMLPLSENGKHIDGMLFASYASA